MGKGEGERGGIPAKMGREVYGRRGRRENWRKQGKFHKIA